MKPPSLPRWSWAVLGITSGVMAITLSWMGRVVWCTRGDLSPVSFDTWSPHNSQHLLDAYSFSHMQHGLLFFLVFALAGRDRWVGERFVVAGLIEAAWEILENSQWIIDRYRENTVSLDYNGDSVANSLSDLACCMAGYLLARRLPWWGTVLVFVVVELAMLVAIRDSLFLNVLMLVYPLEAVKAWQSG